MPAFAFAALIGSACADDPRRPPVTNDAVGGNSGGATVDAGAARDGAVDGDAAASCTELEATGSIIDQNAVNIDQNAGTGGVIADGTYDLTSASLHVGAAGLPGPTGSSYQGSIRFDGGSFERVIVFRSSAGASTETRTSGTFTTIGPSATLSATCPSAGQEQLSYSVATTSVTFANLATKESFIFTSRP